MTSEAASAAPDLAEIVRPHRKAAFAAAQPRPSSRNQVQLEWIAKELAGPRQLIEQSFLQMGEGLSGCVKLLETISAAHESLPAEFSSAEFSASAQTLHDIRASVNAMAAAHVGGKDHVGALADAAAGVERPMAELRATVRAIAQIAPTRGSWRRGSSRAARMSLLLPPTWPPLPAWSTRPLTPSRAATSGSSSS
jgi:hypothetical protein